MHLLVVARSLRDYCSVTEALATDVEDHSTILLHARGYGVPWGQSLEAADLEGMAWLGVVMLMEERKTEMTKQGGSWKRGRHRQN